MNEGRREKEREKEWRREEGQRRRRMEKRAERGCSSRERERPLENYKLHVVPN